MGLPQVSAAVRAPFDLEDIRIVPGDDDDIRLYPVAKRVRAFFGDIAIADSTRVQLMLESGRLPVYYFPVEDVRMDLLVVGTRRDSSPSKGQATYLSIDTGTSVALNAAWRYDSSAAGCPDLSSLVAFHWRLMDAWYEEDEEVIAHARDPFHRIDILRSSRHVQVRVGDTVVADTRRSRMLFETGLPVRYYIPREDIRIDLLTPSDSVTACAYKGQTSQYWDLTGGMRDIAWSYAEPSPEAGTVAGLICFFNERAEISVDSVVQQRPLTPWS
jgi:uncharacterized protein (DUF427 family)